MSEEEPFRVQGVYERREGGMVVRRARGALACEVEALSVKASAALPAKGSRGLNAPDLT